MLSSSGTIWNNPEIKRDVQCSVGAMVILAYASELHRLRKENVMAKIPSREFSSAKKKIPSSKFPKAKRKIPSRPFGKQTAKIPSRKFAKTAPKKDVNAPASLVHPTDEQARQEAVAALKSRTEALKGGER